MYFPEARTSGLVVEYFDSQLTLQSHENSKQVCRRLYRDPEDTTGTVLQYTHESSMKTLQASPCPDGGLSPACDGLTGAVTLTAILHRDSAVKHRVPKGECVDAGRPWITLQPVDCAYKDPVVWDLYVYLVAIGLPVCIGLCALAGLWLLCRHWADDPSPWTCFCRLFCWTFFNYGVNARVVPLPPPIEEEPVQEKYRAKKYRRQTTAELAGQLSTEEVEARHKLQQEALTRQKKRRNTLAHVGDSTLQPFSGPAKFERPSDPMDNFIPKAKAKEAPDPGSKKKRRASGVERKRRASVSW